MLNSKKTNTLESIKVDSNHIYINCVIDEKLAQELMMELNRLEVSDISINERGIIEYTSPIVIHISSLGGGAYEGLLLFDIIKNLNRPTVSIIEGYCASAATFVSLACDERYMRSHSFTLIHQLSAWLYGKYDDLVDQKKHLDNISHMALNIYSEHTKLSKKKLRKLLKKDLWLNSKTSLEYGLVDEII